KGSSVPICCSNNALRKIPVEGEHPFRESEHRFRKLTEKCSRSAGMAVHVEPEWVFTFCRNRCSRWAGICSRLAACPECGHVRAVALLALMRGEQRVNVRLRYGRALCWRFVRRVAVLFGNIEQRACLPIARASCQ